MQSTDNAVYRYPVQPCTLVYVILMALTVITWLVGKTGLGGLEIALPILFAALFKGLLIGDYYMGLKGVHGLWRWVIIIWLFVPGSMITWAFVSAS
jgi:hypothetical protein